MDNANMVGGMIANEVADIGRDVSNVYRGAVSISREVISGAIEGLSHRLPDPSLNSVRTGDKVLTMSHSGEDVKQLQRLINEERRRSNLPQLQENGNFDSATSDAMINFLQRLYGARISTEQVNPYAKTETIHVGRTQLKDLEGYLQQGSNYKAAQTTFATAGK